MTGVLKVNCVDLNLDQNLIFLTTTWIETWILDDNMDRILNFARNHEPKFEIELCFFQVFEPYLPKIKVETCMNDVVYVITSTEKNWYQQNGFSTSEDEVNYQYTAKSNRIEFFDYFVKILRLIVLSRKVWLILQIPVFEQQVFSQKNMSFS